jgi:hypothetical protein
MESSHSIIFNYDAIGFAWSIVEDVFSLPNYRYEHVEYIK